MSGEIRNLILEMADIDEVRREVLKKLELGIDPLTIIDVLNRTLDEVGRRYEEGDLFLSQLIFIGYVASEVTKQLKPYLTGKGRERRGKVIIGTVRGDIHDIGKNIVIMMLQAAECEVVDLGVDVPADTFIEAVREERPDILGLSALLTSTMNEMKVVIDALEMGGLRGEVKVIVGGRSITEGFAKEIGADGYAEDAVKAINVVRELLGLEGGRR